MRKGDRMIGGVPPDPQQMARMERLAELARTLPQTQAQVQAAQAREAVRLAEEARRQAQAAQRREVLAQVQAQARAAQAQTKKATKKKAKKVAPRADSAGGDPKRVKKESALKMSSKETKQVLDSLEASPPSSPAPSEDSYFRDALDALAEDDSDDFDFEGMEGMGRSAMRNHRMVGGNLWDDIVDGVSMVFGSGRPTGLARPAVFERPPAQYPYLL